MISAMVIWAVCNPAAALSAEDDQAFVEMINQIREAPYDYAIGLDYTPEDLIDKGIEPETRYESYSLDEDLSATAADESHDIAETESQLMPDEEITEPEAPPVYRLTASTGGVVSFFNFMTRKEAFKIVIDYLFKEELDTNTFDHILSEKYAYAGIAISAGKVGSGNAWFVSIRLRSAERVSEIQMLNMINQLRDDPENIWEYKQLNKAQAFELNSNIIDLLLTEYKPLFFDASLSASAREHLSETQTDLEMYDYHGYQGEIVQASDVEIRSLTEEDGRSVDLLFESLLFSYELIDWPSSYVVFLRDVQDVGSNITYQSGDNKIGSSVLSFVVGKNEPTTSSDENIDSNTDEYSKIYGVLFSDNDGDGLYAPGEELIQKTVIAYDDAMQAVETAVTDNAGHFFMTLEPNRQYRFVATIDDVLVEKESVFITSDQFVKLVYAPDLQ
jgi:hypothetical protein